MLQSHFEPLGSKSSSKQTSKSNKIRARPAEQKTLQVHKQKQKSHRPYYYE